MSAGSEMPRYLPGRRARRVLAGLGALVALAAGLPAAAAPTDAQAGGVVARLTGLPAAVVTPGQGFAVEVGVENLGSVSVDDAAVSFALTREPLAGVEAIQGFVAGADTAVRTVARTSIGSPSAATGGEPSTRLLAGDVTSVTAEATSDTLALPQDAWGVYGVVVRLETSEGWTTIDRGTLTWAGVPIPELGVAAIAVASGETVRARAVAGASDVPGVSLLLDEDSLGRVGGAGLNLAEREVFRLPTANPDMVSLAHAEDQEMMAYALDRSRRSELEATRDMPWIAVATALDRSTAAYALANGASAVLLDGRAADTAAGADDSALRSIAVAAGSVRVLVPEPTLSETARGTGAAAPALAVAQAAALAGAGSGTVLVSPGVAWAPAGTNASATLLALSAAPFVASVDVSDLIAGDGGAPLGAPRFADTQDDLAASTLAGLARRLDRSR
ncbi:hypothetical protein, partial [Demequina sp.]|uniref:hypothetical protein n=1 Tax=Demequina sp. TaxID=2050685 RepID=UPI0025DAC5A8